MQEHRDCNVTGRRVLRSGGDGQCAPPRYLGIRLCIPAGYRVRTRVCTQIELWFPGYIG
jgi:hypothetical protein